MAALVALLMLVAGAQAAAPTATIVVANDRLGIGATSTVTITFSEAVTALTLANLSATNATLSNLSTSDNITFTATLAPVAGTNQGGNTVQLNLAQVTDQSGTPGSGTVVSNTYTIDSNRPTATVTITSTALLAGNTMQVTVTFSEAVMGFTNDDVTAPNGTLSTLSSVDGGTTWTATFTPTPNLQDATNIIIVDNAGVTDLAGNAGTGTTDSINFTINTVRPAATDIALASHALRIGETTQVTITFSEAVADFTNGDVTTPNGTLSPPTSSNGGITWTATFTPTPNIQEATNAMSVDNTGVTNGVGNAGLGSLSSNNYAIDTLRPTATITVTPAQIHVGATAAVTIAFSEPVTGLNFFDLSVANGTLDHLSSADGGKTWTATLTPTSGVSDSTNLIVLDTSLVTDLAGNVGTGIAISNNYAVGVSPPTPVVQPVPVDNPWALAALAACVGALAWRRRWARI